MQRRTRVIPAAIFAGLLAIVASAGLTYACTTETFGTPKAPGAAPSPGQDASTAAPTPPAPDPAAPTPRAPDQAPAATPSPAQSGATSVSGARSAPKAPSAVRVPSGIRGNARAGAPARRSSGVASTQFAQRERGQTGGVTRSGGRAVFGTPARRAKSKAAGSVPSSRSAASDLWSGFGPQARSSVSAAEALAGQRGGAGGPATALMVVFGLGVGGALASAAALRRRRYAGAEASSDSRRSASMTD